MLDMSNNIQISKGKYDELLHHTFHKFVHTIHYPKESRGEYEVILSVDELKYAIISLFGQSPPKRDLVRILSLSTKWSDLSHGYVDIEDFKACISYLMSSDDYRYELYPVTKVFESLDRKKRGYISLEDFQNAIDIQGLNSDHKIDPIAIFRSADTLGINKVTISQFRAMVTRYIL